ncbi:hypothetical protein ABPG75_009786 [Micractinium tetrahymenae]
MPTNEDIDAAASRVDFDDPRSYIQTEKWKRDYRELCSGEVPNIDKMYVRTRVAPQHEIFRGFTPEHGFNLLQHAATQCDVPMMAQLLMRGADLEWGADEGFSPLAMALSSTAHAAQDRSMLQRVKRAVGFLLAVGANPNARYAKSILDDPLIMLAAMAARQFGEWGLLEAMLRHGADPAARSGRSGTTAASLLSHTAAARQRWERLMQQYRGKPRPPRRCPCGAGSLYLDCHAEEDEGRTDGKSGKEADPEGYCPCRSGRKYGRCCQRKGIMYHETLRNTYQHKTMHGPAAQLMQQYVMMRQQQAAAGDDNPRLFPQQFDGHGRPIDMFKEMTARLLVPLREAGLIDPAFYYAAEKVDFLLRGHWPEATLPRIEMLKRKEEVNSAVDEYIALGTDPRPALEIERAAKIAVDGGPLFRRCAGCGVYETAWGEHKACAACKSVCYCGRECQVEHWKAGHKRVCASRPAKAVSRSQLAFNLAGEAFSLQLLQGEAMAAHVQRELAAMDAAAAADNAR